MYSRIRIINKYVSAILVNIFSIRGRDKNIKSKNKSSVVLYLNWKHCSEFLIKISHKNDQRQHDFFIYW